MKIQYLHASKFGNGAMVATEFARLMTPAIHEEATRQAATVPARPGASLERPSSRGRARRRTVARTEERLGASAWPAYLAAGMTGAYGLLKAYWVLGGTALWSIAPLPEELIDDIRAGTAPTWFEIADAASVGLAVAGVAFALATLRPRRWLPVRLVRWSLLPLATFMVLRGALSVVGDVQQIASGAAGPVTHTAIWDLVLWSPYFLVWGLAWAATALTYTRRVAMREDDTAARGTHRPSPTAR